MEAVTLPDPSGIKNPTPVYEPILREMGVTTKQEIDELRWLIDEKTVDMGREIAMQNARDFASGKRTNVEDMPMYREEKPDGRVVIHNIPPEVMKWYGFLAWLNDRSAGRR